MSLKIGRYDVHIGAAGGACIGLVPLIPFMYLHPVNGPIDVVYNVSLEIGGFALGGLVGGAIDYYRQKRSDKRPLGSR